MVNSLCFPLQVLSLEALCSESFFSPNDATAWVGPFQVLCAGSRGGGRGRWATPPRMKHTSIWLLHLLCSTVQSDSGFTVGLRGLRVKTKLLAMPRSGPQLYRGFVFGENLYCGFLLPLFFSLSLPHPFFLTPQDLGAPPMDSESLSGDPESK